jgi:DNA-binding transcriptional LysR family regulator
LAAFDAVARAKSFRRASEERGVTASAISHAVSNLEGRVGIRLLNRTTRSVSLTNAGAMLHARLSPAEILDPRRRIGSIFIIRHANTSLRACVP